MHISSDTVLRDRYDVIVVGAGIGGLTAAALVARRGLKTLVLEQHYIPGGVCSAIRRRDTAMDVGAAMLFGWDEKGYNPHRFVMNELEEEIDMIPHQSIYRVHLEDGRQVTFWRDMERFLGELCAAFPDQEQGIRGFYAELKAFYDDAVMPNDIPLPPTEIPWREHLRLLKDKPRSVLAILKYWFKTEEDILKKYVTDPKLMGFFDFMTGTYTCCNVTESPALLATTMFIENHVGGACYPSGSPQMLPNKLEKAIEKFGGQVAYRKMVEEILIWQGKAYGVRLSDGTEILAESVISNASVWSLYEKLINPRHISPKRLAWARRFEPTLGTLLLYLVVKAEAVPPESRPIELFIENIYDFSGPNFCTFIPSLDDPSIAPPGTHSITVIAPNKVKWPRPGDPFYQSEAYNELKAREADKVLTRMQKRYFPRIKESILSMDIGTPSTIERYAMKPWGNVGGPKLSMKQGFFYRLKARSDWKNLYCAGDSTSMGEGVIATTVSGVGAANRLLEDRGLPIYLPRKFPRQYVSLIHGKPWSPPPPATEPVTEANARRIARDCQHCEKPECRAACPAGIDTCYFARRIEAGNFIGAARVLRDVNPFSEVCGEICPADRFCQKKCNRRDFDERAVRIRELHGWVCRHVSGPEGWERYTLPRNGKKVAVVGAGPAGLTCAHYLARLGYAAVLWDKADRPGGMVALAVPAFRLSEEVVAREIQGLTLPGMEFRFGQALGKDVDMERLEREHDAVFLAPGLWAGRTLEIPGLARKRTTDALSFLASSRSAGKARVGKRVLVIGGGSVAADAAMTARRNKAGAVTLVCLEQEAEMPALPEEIASLRKEGVQVLNGWGPREVADDQRMRFVKCASVLDAEGRFAPAYDDSQSMEQAFDQAILAVGQRVEPALASYLEQEFGWDGKVPVDPETLQVEGRAGVYAGGDLVRGAGTVAEAVGDGRRAAQSVHALLSRRR